MRKFLLLALAMCLAAAPCLAAGLDRAIPSYDLAAFDKYSGFEMDEQTGDWALRGNEAEAMLRSVREGAMRSYASSGNVVFYVQVEGNQRTGECAVYLYLNYVGPALHATAVSFRVGDVRYDLPVYSERVTVGSQELEQLSALLNDDALSMLSKISESEIVSLRLHGEDSYTTELRVRKTYDNARQRLESMSLSCVNLTRELETLNYAAYALREETSKRWYNRTGVAAAFEATELSKEIVLKGALIPVLDKEMGMLSSGSNNRNNKLLRDKLIEIKYLAGASGNDYGANTKKAVEDIQRMHGLIPTGSADGRVLNLLFGEAVSKDAVPEPVLPAVEAVRGAADAEPGVKYAIADEAELTLNRYWFANAVSSTKSAGGMGEYSASNRDNLLLVVDGAIKNLSANEMGFNRSITAKAVYGGKYSYDMQIRCETDGGERFDSALLPLGEARVVLMAEIPAAAAMGDQGWTIQITLGENTLSYRIN